jgi:hypothetical protein
MERLRRSRALLTAAVLTVITGCGSGPGAQNALDSANRAADTVLPTPDVTAVTSGTGATPVAPSATALDTAATAASAAAAATDTASQRRTPPAGYDRPYEATKETQWNANPQGPQPGRTGTIAAGTRIMLNREPTTDAGGATWQDAWVPTVGRVFVHPSDFRKAP